MKKITIDSREQKRIPIATEYFKKQGYEVSVEEMPTGDYLFNDKVVFEFKTWGDFMASITDGRLWNESQKQMENYNIHFVVIHGTNRDYQDAFQHNGLEDKMITGSIARLNTYTTVIEASTEHQAIMFMRIQAHKCLDNKHIVKRLAQKTDNPAFNYLVGVKHIGDDTADIIVDGLQLETLEDLLNIKNNELQALKGIGSQKAGVVMRAIKNGRG